MSIEEAVAKDLVAVLLVTFLFGGMAVWLIVGTLAEHLRRVWAAERVAGLKQTMIDAGFRADEIVRVLNAGRQE
jgi:hypothetical protein